jgi:SAM-dependent methyltransferase
MSPPEDEQTLARVLAEQKYLSIVADTEVDLATHGDSYLGVGWTKSEEHADRRHRVSLELVRRRPDEEVSLLDFGCGASHLYEYMLEHGVTGVRYSGLDLSSKFVELSRGKHPSVDYYCLDVLQNGTGDLPSFDYVVMSGLFTYKGQLSFDEMIAYCKELLAAVFPKARRGLAFNAMTKYVDWEREDLFHLPFDAIASFLVEHLSRHLVVRHDYGLYEYFVYVYREPLLAATAVRPLEADLPKSTGP